MIFESFPVERFELLPGTGAPVEPLRGFIAKPAAFDHGAQEPGHLEAFAHWVSWRESVEILGEVRPDIEADYVEEAELCRCGKADQRSGKGVNLLDAEGLFHGQTQHGADEERSDAIGYEVGGVLGAHDALAEPDVAEFGDPVERFAARLRRGNHFDEIEIARGIEEVRAEKVAATQRRSPPRCAPGECHWCWWKRSFQAAATAPRARTARA